MPAELAHNITGPVQDDVGLPTFQCLELKHGMFFARSVVSSMKLFKFKDVES